MSAMWIDDEYRQANVGDVGFLIEVGTRVHLRDRPAYTNQSNEPRLLGWCGSWNNVSTTALGVARVSRVTSNGRALVKRLRGAELEAALDTLGYPDLG